MIAPSRARAYRTFYLYSALTLALTAVAVAVTLLLRALLQRPDLNPELYPTVKADEIARGVSLAVAILAVAIPVGGAHLLFVRRLLRDPDEGAGDIRHEFLSLWVAAALLSELVTAIAVMNAITSPHPRPDTTLGFAIFPVAAAVALLAVWWAARTPPARAIWRVRAAVVVLVLSMAVVAFAAGNAASAGGGLLATPADAPPPFRAFDPRAFQERAFASGLLIAAAALVVWTAALAWVWRWRERRERLGYAGVGYGAGIGLLFGALAYELAGGIRVAVEARAVSALTGPWALLAAGAVLAGVHGALLLVDRGRNGQPPIVMTRLLLAVPATAGLAALLAGIAVTWRVVVDRTLGSSAGSDDLPLAVGFFVVGATYPLAAIPFFRRSPPASAIRRFYLYDVVCLGLFATVAAAVIAAYNAILVAIGTGGESGRTALQWSLPTLALAVVFAIHLRALLRDHRMTAVSPATATVDPVAAILEQVRDGRMSPEAAAALLRER